jgi:hypothetical protein
MLHHMVIQALDDAEERLPTVLRGEWDGKGREIGRKFWVVCLVGTPFS